MIDVKWGYLWGISNMFMQGHDRRNKEIKGRMPTIPPCAGINVILPIITAKGEIATSKQELLDAA